MQYRAIQCNIMQYNAITCIIYNCWQSVPLPCGQYEAIFTILNKCWHKTKQILAGCRLRKTGCMCIDSKKVSKWVGLKQQKHCTCFLRLWLTIDIIIVWFPNKEKSNGCKKKRPMFFPFSNVSEPLYPVNPGDFLRNQDYHTNPGSLQFLRKEDVSLWWCCREVCLSPTK